MPQGLEESLAPGLFANFANVLTKFLLTRLAHAETMAVARPLVWALEARTGIKTKTLLEQKQVSIAGYTGDPDWYRREGFWKLAALRGAGYGSSTGIAISPETVLQASAMLACVKIIAEDIGTMPFFPYVRSEDGSQSEKAYGHPLYRTLHDQPNPEMSAGEFREALTARMLLGVDAYARIERFRGNTKIVLWPIGKCMAGGWIDATVRQERDSNRQPVYVIKEGNAAEQAYRADQILHLRGFTFDGWTGDALLLRARDVLGLTVAGQEYAARYFSQSAEPGLVVTRKEGLPAWGPEKLKEWKEAWLGSFGGLAGKHAPAILQDGMTVSRTDPDHQKLQMIESRKFQVAEVARLYRMPLHKLAELDRATFSNIEHQAIEYVTHTLGRWISRWEEGIERSLLSDDERYWSSGRPRMYVELEEKALLRGDFQTQVEGLVKLLTASVVSPNEVRSIFNMNPFEGGDGHYLQINMANVADTARQIIKETAPMVADQAVRKMLVELLEQKLIPAPPQEVQ